MASAESVGYSLEKLDIDKKNDDYMDYEPEDYMDDEPQRPQRNLVVQAVINGDILALQQALANPENIKYLNMPNDVPPLHAACYCQNLQCVDLLLDNEDVELTLCDNFGVTPIHIVCATGNLAILERFIETFEEFDEPLFQQLMDVRTDYGQSPLHAAAAGPNPKDMVPYLLDHGACAISVDKQDKYPSDYCRDYIVKKMLVDKEDEQSKELEAAELEKKDVDKASAESSTDERSKSSLGAVSTIY